MVWGHPFSTYARERQGGGKWSLAKTPSYDGGGVIHSATVFLYPCVRIQEWGTTKAYTTKGRRGVKYSRNFA